MSNFFFYKAYGLGIVSSIAFPELISEKTYADVIIRIDSEETFSKGMVPMTKNNKLHTIQNSPQDISFLWEKKPLFRVKYGKEIIVNSNVNIEEMFLRSLLLGQGMGVLLYQRGYLVLHGSAVNINGNAIGFVGWQGEGKSTTAAALNAKGYPLVTDDILTIDFDEYNKPIILPGFPRIKLWNDVIKIMTDNAHLFPKILPEVQKYSYTADTHFKTESLPLKIIYILEKSKKNEINHLNFQNSLINLLKQSYNINLFDANEKAQNFFQCINLVKNVPVKRLKRCQSLKTLIDLAHIIEEDVFNLK